MSTNDQSSRTASRNIAELFDKAELKSLFIKFLILMGSVEIVIFSVCWLYQLGLKEFDRYGNVNIPFPWKTFFLLAFLVPVGITFLLGLFVSAFNHYMQGTREPFCLSHKELKSLWRLKTWRGMFSQVPFLVMLLLLGLVAGIIYNLDAILLLIGNLGDVAFKYMVMIAAFVLILMVLVGLIWMVMLYKLKKKTIEYQYKKDVMEQLGIILLDEGTIIDADGRRIAMDSAGKLQDKKQERLTPPNSSGKKD
jgi:hypothetical protein